MPGEWGLRQEDWKSVGVTLTKDSLLFSPFFPGHHLSWREGRLDLSLRWAVYPFCDFLSQLPKPLSPRRPKLGHSLSDMKKMERITRVFRILPRVVTGKYLTADLVCDWMLSVCGDQKRSAASAGRVVKSL